MSDLPRASEAKRIIGDLSFAQGMAFEALNMSAATINRKAARDQTLSTDESERVIGVAKLIGQLVAMIEDSGDPGGFDVAAWLSRWLGEPLLALGGRLPLDLLDTMEGQALVGATLARMQTGAYAGATSSGGSHPLRRTTKLTTLPEREPNRAAAAGTREAFLSCTPPRPVLWLASRPSCI